MNSLAAPITQDQYSLDMTKVGMGNASVFCIVCLVLKLHLKRREFWSILVFDLVRRRCSSTTDMTLLWLTNLLQCFWNPLLLSHLSWEFLHAISVRRVRGNFRKASIENYYFQSRTLEMMSQIIHKVKLRLQIINCRRLNFIMKVFHLQ